MTTLRERPLWQQRIWLVVLSPILLFIALWSALLEGGEEFWWEIKNAARDVRDIWTGRN